MIDLGQYINGESNSLVYSILNRCKISTSCSLFDYYLYFYLLDKINVTSIETDLQKTTH